MVSKFQKFITRLERSMMMSLFSFVLSCLVLSSYAGNFAPAGFTENKGQFSDQKGDLHPEIFFKGNISGAPGIFITDKGITYLFLEGSGERTCDPNAEPEVSVSNWSRIDMVLENSNIKKENVSMEDPLPGYSNYYLGHCPQGILDVLTYRKITFRNVYPGIDWSLFINETNDLEYDFILHPGADPSNIKIRYNGADKIQLADPGNLLLATSCGQLFEGDLFSYEQHSHNEISSHYVLHDNEISFAIGTYNDNETLIIDPPLQWSSRQAGSGNEIAYAIAAAKDGTSDSFITGVTDSPDLPMMNAFQGTFAGNEDIFVQRLDANGARVWSTYYGGSLLDGGKGIATDNSGNTYVVGYAAGNLPLFNNVQVGYGGGTYDAALVKFNSAGVRQWATEYGGTGTDYATAVCCDNVGNVFVTGYTNSSNFPVVNAIYPSQAAVMDAFILKINPSRTIRWADYFGGNDEDRGRAITLDPAGTNVYFTGSTLSSVLHITVGAFQNFNASFLNAEDVFIAKMDTAGQNTLFSTFCGGTDADFGQGISVDGTGKVFVTGYTLSNDFPCVNPGLPAYFDNTIGSPSTHDAFIVECNSTGTTEIWGTYFGGSGVDMGLAITSDQSAGIHITGSSASTDFPVQSPTDLIYYQSTQGDGGSFGDFFISWFYNDHKLLWSTYYGGTFNDEGHGISTDLSGNVYVAGLDSNDAMVLKFGPGPANSVISCETGSGITVFPQPATDHLMIDLPLAMDQTAKAEVYDIFGNRVSIFSVSEKQTKLDLSSFAPGIYLIKVRIGEIEASKIFTKAN